ncbi:MAG: serine/threonine-protein kinase [Polyangiaceae bacterium]
MTALEAGIGGSFEVRSGVRLGRYEILLGIAEGGMARVWAAKQHGQRGFSKVVAIKTILPALASDPDFEAMFLDEARVAAGVHHPNVCEIFDLGEEHGVLYIAMEWVNGESLARIFKPARKDGQRGTAMPVDYRVAARIIADAAAGLHSAHQLKGEQGEPLNVVHRDVSPQNILVGVNGTVKVTDFGVAKALGTSHEATAAGQIKGKAAYMAPEQAGGGKLDRRSDVFALGICLYEVTTGARPFSGENQVAVLKALLSGAFAAPRELVPDYPPELEAIVLKAMNINPDARFATADEMRVALEEYLAHSGSIVTETQVAELVRARVGSVVDQRSQLIRDRTRNSARSPEASFAPAADGSSSKISNPSASAIRAVQPTTSPSGPSSVSGPTFYPTPQPLVVTEKDTTARTALIGIGIGVVVFVLAGAGIFLLRGRGATPPQAAAATVNQPAALPPAPTASAVAKPVATASAKIKIVALSPKAGVVFELDGKKLDATEPEVDRPASGRVGLLKVSAAGHHTDTLRIDRDTPALLEVMLAKLDEPAPTSADKPRDDKPAPGPTPLEAPKPKKPPKVDIPDNPF